MRNGCIVYLAVRAEGVANPTETMLVVFEARAVARTKLRQHNLGRAWERRLTDLWVGLDRLIPYCFRNYLSRL